MENSKTLTNTTAKGAKTQVKDIEFWGDGDTFKLISKQFLSVIGDNSAYYCESLQPDF